MTSAARPGGQSPPDRFGTGRKLPGSARHPDALVPASAPGPNQGDRIRQDASGFSVSLWRCLDEQSRTLAQREFLNLASPRHRQLLNNFYPLGQFVDGDASHVFQVLGQLVQSRLSGLRRDHESASPLTHQPIRHGYHGYSLDFGMGQQMLLDFGRADIGSASNDYILDAALQTEQTALVELTEVAGVIPALRVNRDCGPLGITPVAEHRAGPPVVHLACDARRNPRALLINHPDLDAIEGRPACADPGTH